MTIYEVLCLIFFSVACLSLGIVGPFLPARIRSYALRTTPRWNPFRGFMETNGYLWSLRLCGALAMVMFLILLAALTFGKR